MKKKHELSWDNNSYSPFIRQVKTFFIALKFLLFLLWDNLLGNNLSKQKTRRAKWLVRNLLNLGPTFIKIGQAL